MKLGNIFKIVKFIVQYPRVEPCPLRQDAIVARHIVARSNSNDQGRQSVLKSEGDKLENEEVRGYMLS